MGSDGYAPGQDPRYELNERLGGPHTRRGRFGMVYLTAIGLTPCGSSRVHIYTRTTTEQHNETEYLERNIHNNKNT